jgi:hypothetical protein
MAEEALRPIGQPWLGSSSSSAAVHGHLAVQDGRDRPARDVQALPWAVVGFMQVVTHQDRVDGAVEDRDVRVTPNGDD